MKVKEFLKNSMEYLNFDKEVIENAIELANDKKSQMLIDSQYKVGGSVNQF